MYAAALFVLGVLGACAAPPPESPSGAGTALETSMLETTETKSCCQTDNAGTLAFGGEALELFDTVDLAGAAARLEADSVGEKPTAIGVSAGSKLTVPDVELVDQDGERIRFYTDVVKGRVVAMNFIFTTCTTICPPLTANFARLQRLLGERLGKEVHLVTVSVDPLTDTPERLHAWGEKFGARPGWTFLTGTKRDVDTVLKDLGVFSPIKEEHSPLVLVGNETEGRWTRINGLASPSKLLAAVDELCGARDEALSAGATASVEPSDGRTAAAQIDDREDPAIAGTSATLTETTEADSPSTTTHASENSLSGPASGARSESPSATEAPENPQAHAYFTDVELINQRGETMRLYSDLIKGKVVVIDCFFSECTSVCPVMNEKFLAIQDALADHLGKDLHLISLSVDSTRDTPERLAAYAEKLRAREGWYFLTGKKENIDEALRKVGLYVESRESHSNIFLVGNDRTGLWKKAFGLAKSADIVEVVESVFADTVP